MPIISNDQKIASTLTIKSFFHYNFALILLSYHKQHPNNKILSGHYHVALKRTNIRIYLNFYLVSNKQICQF